MIRQRLRGFFSFTRQGRVRRAPPAIHGTLRQAVVLPSPDPLFSEAVYILRNDTGLSRAELLTQAKSAAEHHCAETFPKAALFPGVLFSLLCFFSGCAVSALCIFLLL